ncbi:MAG: hypothetical protein JRE16_06860 [Deltaproteobacteria bacterium]|nr:hypothetical protein [Deltaproteobacteria bacterium]MBW2504275.1 hypothetical protein [Deltaproteobacteria bacterium]
MPFQCRLVLLFAMINLMFCGSVDAFLGFGESKELDEKERQETIERIEDVQNKLKLLQEKLKALERRKAAEQAAQRAATAGETIPQTPVQVNWLPIEDTVNYPGDFGIYTYLLFVGNSEDVSAVTALEELILTIETLPTNNNPESLSNRFLIPVEKPQSMVDLGRQPYDYKLNNAYLDRLQLRDSLPKGPILVSLQSPLDPYAAGDLPGFLAVSIGQQKPQKALQLAKVWHNQETGRLQAAEGHPMASLFWDLLAEAGSGQVTRFDQRLLMELTP